MLFNCKSRLDLTSNKKIGRHQISLGTNEHTLCGSEAANQDITDIHFLCIAMVTEMSCLVHEKKVLKKRTKMSVR